MDSHNSNKLFLFPKNQHGHSHYSNLRPQACNDLHNNGWDPDGFTVKTAQQTQQSPVKWVIFTYLLI